MKINKKLILTTHTYYPHKDGVAIVNDYLTKGMVKKGYDVVVVTHEEFDLPNEEYRDGVRILRVYKDDNPQKYIDCIKSLVAPEDTLVNVCTQTPTTDLLLAEIGKIKCFRKVLYVHGIYSFKWNVNDFRSLRSVAAKIYHNYIWNRYYQKNKEYLKHYDVVTQLHLYDEGNIYFKKKLGIESYIFENAADDAFFSEDDGSGILEKYGLVKDYLLCVNNFDTRKNQEMIIKAFFKCQAGIDLVLIGSQKNEYYSKLVKLADTLQTQANKNDIKKRVHFFVNEVPRDHIPTIVKNAKLYLLGSTLEMFPVSIVEAMATGTPFISTDVGVVRYLPGGEIVKVNDVVGMAKAIDRLFQDEALAKRLASDGRDYAMKRMRIEDKVNDFEKICFGHRE